MEIIVWGARGSIPVSGPEFVRYGGDTTCLSVHAKSGERIIVDAGTGIRRLGVETISEMPEGGVLHLLLTHAHWDHISGFPFFRPVFRKEFSIQVHGCSNARDSVKRFLMHTMEPPYFPVPFGVVAADVRTELVCEPSFPIGSIRVTSIPLDHPNGGFGFVFEEDGKSFAFFPDNELGGGHPGGLDFDGYARAVDGVDLLIHDGEYLPEEYETFSRGWGHSVHTDAVRLGKSAGVGSLLLWHLNQDRTDAQTDALVAEATQVAGNGLTVSFARMGWRREL